MEKYVKSNLTKFPFLNLKEDTVEEVAKIQGCWDIEMIIDGEQMFHFQTGPFPFNLTLEKNPLPSDCAFRQDIMAWKMRDLKLGQ